MKVLMVSTFGPNTRGISLYADDLYNAIEKLSLINLNKVDYKAPFPSFLLPNNTNYDANNPYAKIDYKSPTTWNLTKCNNWDALHLQYWSPAYLPIILFLLLKNKKTKIILTWHNPEPHEKFPLIKYIENILVTKCDGIIFHNENCKLHNANSSLKQKSAVIHHGCKIYETKIANEDDYKLCRLDPTREYIFFFGNIRPYKGLDYLIDAWQLIKEKFTNIDLIVAGRLWEPKNSFTSKIVNKIAGTSNYSRYIKNKLAQSEKKQIISDLHFISEDKLNSYLKISKLAIFPYSRFESQSGAAMRAIGNGVPIITTKAGGLTELAINDCFIADTCSVTSLASVIEKCLTEYNEEMRTLQLNIANKSSWGSAAQKHVNFYKKIISA